MNGPSELSQLLPGLCWALSGFNFISHVLDNRHRLFSPRFGTSRMGLCSGTAVGLQVMVLQGHTLLGQGHTDGWTWRIPALPVCHWWIFLCLAASEGFCSLAGSGRAAQDPSPRNVSSAHCSIGFSDLNP